MNEDQLVTYFEKLAIQSKEINHNLNGKKSFFYVEDGFNLDEFDEKIRSAAQSPTLILVADDGTFSDNNTSNHTQEISADLLFIGRIKSNNTIRSIRSECLSIALHFLAKMKYDAGKSKIHPEGKKVFFRIDQIPYKKIGPLNLEWYGYSLTFTLTCPFGYTVNSGTWRDNELLVQPIKGPDD